MKSIDVVLFCFLLFSTLTLPVFAVDIDGKLKSVAQFEGGKLYESGPVKVVELKGTYRQMGRQYGRLMTGDMKTLYKIAITDEYMGNQKFTPDRLKTIAYSLYDIYPRRYQEMFKGIAETSGMSLDDVIILNALEFFPKINHLTFNCSALAVWGDYSKDDTVILGRNNDDSLFFRKFAPYVSVTVLKPDDGSYPTAIINYTGVIYAANGMNSKGVFLELNAGNPEGFYLKRPSIFINLMTWLQDLPSMELINEAIMSTKANMSSIVTIADPEKACSVECSCNNARCWRGVNKGIVAAANHFVDPDWGIAPMNDKLMGWTVIRRNNLLALGEKFKGQFDAKKMMEVFDTVIEDGGATDKNGTTYQIVAVPAKLTLWIKAPTNFDWTEVDLSKLLAE